MIDLPEEVKENIQRQLLDSTKSRIFENRTSIEGKNSNIKYAFVAGLVLIGGVLFDRYCLPLAKSKKVIDVEVTEDEQA